MEDAGPVTIEGVVVRAAEVGVAAALEGIPQ